MKIINTLIKVTTLAVLLIFLFDTSGVVASQKKTDYNSKRGRSFS